MKTSKKIGLGLLGLFLVIQFFQPDRSVPEVQPGNDLIEIYEPSEEIASLLTTACYDCHSYSTHYPWYAYIAPVSWIVSHDIDEGREHLNFSRWGSYDIKKQLHKLEECEEEVEEREMPLEAYTFMHAEAKLTHEQREALELWFAKLRR
jgi:hypothetical protein